MANMGIRKVNYFSEGIFPNDRNNMQTSKDYQEGEIFYNYSSRIMSMSGSDRKFIIILPQSTCVQT